MSHSFVNDRDRERIDTFKSIYQDSQYARYPYGDSSLIMPSPIEEEWVRDHEKMLGASLPPLFRAYLMGWCLGYTDLYVGVLPGISPDQPFKWVEQDSIEKLDQAFYRRNPRLIPFVYLLCSTDYGDLCFDIYRPDATGDYPIIEIECGRQDDNCYEWSDLDCERAKVFPSFSAYLDYLQDWLVYTSAERKVNFEKWLGENGKSGKLRHRE